MAANDRTPQLEPSSFNDRDGLASLYAFLSWTIWCLGGVLTVFAVLAYLGIGSFSDLFDSFLGSEMTIPMIVLLAVGTFFVGLFMATIAKFIRLLKKRTTLTYTLRGLDQVIPRTVSLPEGEAKPAVEKKGPQEGPAGHSSTYELPTRGEGVSITFNLQGQMSDFPKAQIGSSSEEESEDYKSMFLGDN